MAEDRSKLEALDELVNGGDWKRDGSLESRIQVVRKSWFSRCCGQRLCLMDIRLRDRRARVSPANSMLSRQWWSGNSRWWECKACGYKRPH